MKIAFFASGVPAGQPRQRSFYKPGLGVRCYDPGTAEGWKSEVAAAARGHLPASPLKGEIRVEISFSLPRPKAHYRTGANSELLRPGAPGAHVSKPDLDNLAKAVMDCLTRLGVWEDDSQVVSLWVTKQWSRKLDGGAHIIIKQVPA